MLTVCGFIIFFSAFVATLKAAFLPVGTPSEIVAAVVGFFEMTNGVASASGIESAERVFLMCAAIIGWSGVSVHFQIMAICREIKIDFRPYFAAKAAQSALSVVLAYTYLRIFKPDIVPQKETGIFSLFVISETISKIIFGVFAALAIAFILVKMKKKIRRS